MKIYLVDFIASGHHVQYAVHLCRYILEQGYQVVLCTWQPDNRWQPLIDIGVKINYIVSGDEALSKRAFYTIAQFRKGLQTCLKDAAREQADIVHFLYLDRAILFPLWWRSHASGFRMPTCGTLFWPHHFVDTLHINALQRLYHKLVRKALKSLLVRGELATLFVHTERIKEIVLGAMRLDPSEGRCVVVPDPVPDLLELPGQQLSKEESRARLGLPQGRVVLLFFGGLRRDKGPDVLLQAAHFFPPEVLVVFAGGSKNTEASGDLERQVRLQGLNGRVRLEPRYVPDDSVSLYFQAADAIVLPYRHSNVSNVRISGVLSWAIAAKRPIITTDVDGMGTLMRTYGLGLVVDPEDPRALAEAIEQYLKKREAIEASILEGAALYIAQNHWRRTGALVLETYQRVISSVCPMPAALLKR